MAAKGLAAAETLRAANCRSGDVVAAMSAPEKTGRDSRHTGYRM